jgi:F-type H+-transporting ATPase subunit b
VNTVTVSFEGGGGLRVLVNGVEGHQVGQAGEEALDEGPSPIAPEVKELLWGGGAFLVFLVLMRLWLVPKVKQGMDARYGKMRSELESADDIRAQAEGEVAEYQSQLAEVRAEAAGRIDAARRQLEAERAERLTEANDRISARRAEALAEVEAARTAARESVDEAVASVAGRAVELAVGKRPGPEVVRRAVADVTSVGAGP